MSYVLRRNIPRAAGANSFENSLGTSAAPGSLCGCDQTRLVRFERPPFGGSSAVRKGKASGSGAAEPPLRAIRARVRSRIRQLPCRAQCSSGPGYRERWVLIRKRRVWPPAVSSLGGFSPHYVEKNQPFTRGDPPVRQLEVAVCFACSDPPGHRFRPGRTMLVIKCKRIEPKGEFTLHYAMKPAAATRRR